MVTNKSRSSSVNAGFEGKRVATIKKDESFTGERNLKPASAVTGGGLKKKK